MMVHRSHSRPPATAGFSLVEALVGLALLALVLTSSLAVTYRLPRELERLEARKEANRAAESVLESVRAGIVPMLPGRREWPERVVPTERELAAWIEIAPTGTPSLYQVVVEVEYEVLGESRTSTVETLAWRP